MKQIKLYLALLCTLLLAAGCSKEMEMETETTGSASLIQIGGFPAFDQGTDTRAIGTPDPGKTAWAEGDKVLLKLQQKYPTGSGYRETLCYTLTYKAANSNWDIDAPLPGGIINDYRDAFRDVTAHYAPAYEWSTTDKGKLTLISGKSAGTDEFLTYAATAVNLREGISINFSGARPYSRLRMATVTGSTVQLTAPTFTPAGTDVPLADAETLTATSDDKGNAYFYGSWTADTRLTVTLSKDAEVFTFEKTIAAAAAAKSYALGDPRYAEIQVTAPGQLATMLAERLTIVTNLKLTGEINAADFATMNSSMTALTHIDMSGATVTSQAIPNEAFKNNTRIKHIDLPHSIETIETNAFYGCSGLTGSLTIPNSVTTIGYYAFNECSGLTGSLTIPNSITTISDHAFDGCSGFTGSLTIPNSVNWIGNYAFRGCKGFNGTLTFLRTDAMFLGQSAFEGCSGFTGTLTFPNIDYNNTYTICANTFKNCSGFTALEIPSLIVAILSDAFNGCSGFTGKLTLPGSVKTIGASAFNGCSGFTEEIVLPKSITSLKTYIFKGCDNVPSFKIEWETDGILTYSSNMLPADKPIYVRAGTKQEYVTKGWPEAQLQEKTE